MSTFVWVAVGRRSPQPAELSNELGRRVVYTLGPKPDQFFPDEEDAHVRILGPCSRAEIEKVRGEELLRTPSPCLFRKGSGGPHKRSHALDLRGGLDCSQL